jgi:hypothetical protein
MRVIGLAGLLAPPLAQQAPLDLGQLHGLGERRPPPAGALWCSGRGRYRIWTRMAGAFLYPRVEELGVSLAPATESHSRSAVS